MIRFALPDDAAAMLKIYAPYIINTSITFEYDVPTEDAFRARIVEITKKYPWFVYEEDGKILGYAYGSPQYSRAAYQWTVEASIYVDESAKGRHIGTALYDVLLDCLAKQNFCLCYSLIVDDNLPSLKMHEKLGFIEIGRANNTGYKHGAWHGVVTLEKQLNEFTVPPKPIIPITELGYKISVD